MNLADTIINYIKDKEENGYTDVYINPNKTVKRKYSFLDGHTDSFEVMFCIESEIINYQDDTGVVIEDRLLEELKEEIYSKVPDHWDINPNLEDLNIDDYYEL